MRRTGHTHSLDSKEADLYQPTEVTFTDPREFDGDPYDVAQRAVAQAEGILKVYRTALDAAYLMARNAEMERNLAMHKPPAGSDYLMGPQGRRFIKLQDVARTSEKDLQILQTAVAYNPKHPPRA